MFGQYVVFTWNPVTKKMAQGGVTYRVMGTLSSILAHTILLLLVAYLPMILAFSMSTKRSQTSTKQDIKKQKKSLSSNSMVVYLKSMSIWNFFRK